jgi:hypothetical protein
MFKFIPLLVCLFIGMVLQQNCQNPPSKANSFASKSSSSKESAYDSSSILDAIVSDTNNISSGFDVKNKTKLKGLSFVAPPRPFKASPMMDVKAVNADWIAVIPYGFTRVGEAKVHYKPEGGQWWGERPDGVSITIDSAHKAGINVMMKPQVYVPYGWTGGLDFKTDAEWENWEKDYEKYLDIFIKMAIEKNVAMLCIGTEFKISVLRREKFWRSLIAKIRKDYKGKLVYAANWDEYMIVPFWDALDYVGVDAYFSLIQKDTPSVSELRVAWKPHFDTLKSFHKKIQKPILFTEYGYLSVDGCAYQSWDVEKRINSLKINELSQSNALEGLFSTFWKEDWWAGGFLWKWFPEGMGHEGYIEKDYTPQGKEAQKMLTKWYGIKY